MKSRILKLKCQKNAIILAHNYQIPAIYDVADFVGDSFELALRARETDAETIVFCGVHFMAESAKILNPKKRVLLPDLAAGCFMADMITVEKLRERKKEFPAAAVVTYINSTAAIKAESDVIVTSANAVQICRRIDAQQIIFVPDEHLGGFVAEQVTEKQIITWPGFCYVHSKIRPEKVRTAQELHPHAVTLVHPESPKAVRDLANEVCGTGGMVRFVEKSDAREFLIATEMGMLEKLRRAAPQKKFFALAGECLNMKKITLEKVWQSLEKEQFEINVPPKVATGARRALEKMIELSR